MPSDLTKAGLVYTLLAVGAGCGAIGDAVLNHWVRTDRHLWLGVAFTLWLIAVGSFAWVLKAERFTFSAAVVLGLLLHSALAMLFDRLFFGGRLTGWQWAGVLCALLAIVLIERGNEPLSDASPAQSALRQEEDTP